MTREGLLELIALVRQHRSESNDIEVKSARAGTPRRLFQPLSAFANSPGGGLILFGITRNQARYLLGKMWQQGIIQRKGEGKATRYYAPEQL